MENNKIEIKNLTRLYTLVLLKFNNIISGYSILKLLEKDLGKTASPTYVYDFLNKLESNGYIKNLKPSKSKRSKGFQLTSTGNEFVNSILTRFDNLIQVAIQSKLKICVSCGVKLYEDYYSEKIGDKEYYFCCVHCAKAYKQNLNQ